MEDRRAHLATRRDCLVAGRQSEDEQRDAARPLPRRHGGHWTMSDQEVSNERPAPHRSRRQRRVVKPKPRRSEVSE